MHGQAAWRGRKGRKLFRKVSDAQRRIADRKEKAALMDSERRRLLKLCKPDNNGSNISRPKVEKGLKRRKERTKEAVPEAVEETFQTDRTMQLLKAL